MSFIPCKTLVEVLIDQVNSTSKTQKQTLRDALGCCEEAAACTPQSVIYAGAINAPPVPIDPNPPSSTPIPNGGLVAGYQGLLLSAEQSSGASFLWEFSGPQPDRTDEWVAFYTASDKLGCGTLLTVTLTAFCEPNQQGASASSSIGINVSCE